MLLGHLRRCARQHQAARGCSGGGRSAVDQQQRQQQRPIEELPRVGHFFANPFTAADFVDRRRRLFEELSQSAQFAKFARHVLLVPSAQQQYMAHHVPHPLRQNAHLRYLSGHCGADSLLVLTCSAAASDFDAALFVHSQTETERQWDGADPDEAAVSRATGVREVLPVGQRAVDYVAEKLDGGQSALWYNYSEPANPALDRSVVLPAVKRRAPAAILNVEPLVDRLRWLKSPKELAAMRRAAAVGGAAVHAAMRASSPGVNEATLWAVIDFECRRLGAERSAYPPVIGGGDRATTIHYMRNCQPVADGEMVLVDAGAEVQGYVSDITRTWPVSGEFSEQQRVVYEVVQQLLQDCAAACGAGVSLDDVHLLMADRMRRYLAEAGALTDEAKAMSSHALCQALCPHHVSHYLGMDVHDTPSVQRSQPLRPGVAFPLEPGVYLPHSCRLVRPQFRGVGGVRLENDFFMDNAGRAVPLNCDTVLHPDDVQRMVAGTSYCPTVP